MTTRIEPSLESFNKKLYSLESAIKNRELITDSLSVISKHSIRYAILKLCAPFYYLFNKDPFSHVRVERVFSSLHSYLQKNSSYLNRSSELPFDLKEHLFYPLAERVKLDNKKILSTYEHKICRLFPKSTDLMIWPEDPSLIGVCAKEKKEIDHFMINFHKSQKTRAKTSFLFCKKEGERNLSLKLDDKIIQSQKISKSLFAVKIDGIYHMILSSKISVGSGGERKKIRLCWDLTDGKKLVKKPLISSYERNIVSILRDRKIPNILSIKEIIPAQKPNSFGKTLEEFYPHTLSSAIKQKDFLSFSQKIEITKQLINSLCKMHEQKIDIKFNLGSNSEAFNTSLNFFHKDIKPSNILLADKKEDGKIEAVFSDFGSSCDPFSLGYSRPYRPPELLFFSKKTLKTLSGNERKERVLNFNLYYGQSGDIWSFGLTLLILFYPNGYRTPTELLPSLHLFQSNFEIDSILLDQDILDRELQLIYHQIISSLSDDQKIQFDLIWDSIIVPALWIHPENRANAPFLLNSAKAL